MRHHHTHTHNYYYTQCMRRSGSFCRHWTSSEYEQISGEPGPIITSSHAPHDGEGGLHSGAQTCVARANPATFARVLITVGINFYPTVVCSSSHIALSQPGRGKGKRTNITKHRAGLHLHRSVSLTSIDCVDRCRSSEEDKSFESSLQRTYTH